MAMPCHFDQVYCGINNEKIKFLLNIRLFRVKVSQNETGKNIFQNISFGTRSGNRGGFAGAVHIHHDCKAGLQVDECIGACRRAGGKFCR